MTGQYSDADEPTCKYCGGSVDRIISEGAPYWHCDDHGKLDVSEVLGIEPGEIPREASCSGGDRDGE